MLGDPDVLFLLVDNGELVGVLIFNEGTVQGFKEVWEERSIDQI